ncbi:MAG: 16S rRNA (uracil(1498)-N(3))-methyltransferase [Rhodobiaceae bacterium]|nr:16S rRNA (uracil(1498)-N(3))-methyltransferase [Rhodobiaceae bacterium]MCC0054853.1 16S rRNA (uracil(1498)-N(3))-methyltransferase [Rhodobiaceae bacterium]
MSEKSVPRLFVDFALGEEVSLAGPQAHYLINVMRRKTGDPVILFNGRDGEWVYEAGSVARREIALAPGKKIRDQTAPADLELLFAPLKKARTDYAAQKATELGVSRLRPVLTARTIAERVNSDRLHANAVEAAEQCGLLWVPEIMEPISLVDVIANWPSGRALIFCDETAAAGSPLEALSRLGRGAKSVLIGPEGGFTPEEAKAIRAVDSTLAISLGPRIMRADTAAVAALSLVQAACGDWRA